MGKELGIRIAPGADGSLVFCSQCHQLLQRGIRVIRFNQDLRVFDEVGIFHEECVEDPVTLLERSEFHVIPAVFLRSAI